MIKPLFHVSVARIVTVCSKQAAMLAHHSLKLDKALKLPTSRRTEIACRLIQGLDTLVRDTTNNKWAQDVADVLDGADFDARSLEDLRYDEGGRDDGNSETECQGTPTERETKKKFHALVCILANGFMKSTWEEQEIVLLGVDGFDIGQVISFCRAKMDESASVFASITEHHHALKKAAVTKDWAEALQASSQGLESYADAAVRMGHKNWVKEGHRWTESRAEEYYFGNLAKNTWVNSLKESYCRRADGSFDRDSLQRLKDSYRAPSVRDDGKLNLLDVGSCFNPHADGDKKELFRVVAVDLMPQDETVLACDFIGVELGDDFVMDGRVVKQLPREFFHVVTMSLVLCYLPTAYEREAMVSKARASLVRESELSPGGVLIISEKGSIFPVTGQMHTSYYRTWRAAMLRLGFALIRYEIKVVDRKRLHLFAFRRIEIDAAAESDQEGQLVPRLVIKSDFTNQTTEGDWRKEESLLN